MNETFRFMPNAHIQPFSCFQKTQGFAKLPSAFFLRPLSYGFQKFSSLKNKKMAEYLLKGNGFNSADVGSNPGKKQKLFLAAPSVRHRNKCAHWYVGKNFLRRVIKGVV